jgi:hypothetical protein
MSLLILLVDDAANSGNLKLPQNRGSMTDFGHRSADRSAELSTVRKLAND